MFTSRILAVLALHSHLKYDHSICCCKKMFRCAHPVLLNHPDSTGDAHPEPNIEILTIRSSLCDRCDCKPSHDFVNFDFDVVSDFCAGHKNHKTLYTGYAISFSGNVFYGDIILRAFGNWCIVGFFFKQFYPSFLV